MHTLLAMDGDHVWCPSVVQWAGRWWLFHSRWPVRLGFEAWVTHSTIAVAVGDRPEGPYTNVHEVLPGSGSGWDADVTHNPCVVVHGGRLWLAYMGNYGPAPRHAVATSEQWWTHRNHQCIGLAWATDPRGPWHRSSQPLIAPASVPWPSLMASNPALAISPDGSLRMIYKSVAHGPLPFGGEVRHVVAEASHPDGPWTHLPHAVLTAPGSSFAAEDPYLWHADGQWHLIAKDMKGVFTGIGTSIARFVSADGRDWQLASPSLVTGLKQGEVMFDRLERPSVVAGRWLVCAALREGRTSIVAIPWQ